MADRDRFELDLATALRAYAKDAPTEVRPSELARYFAAAHPHATSAIGPWRRGAIPRLAWLVLLVAVASVAMIAGLLVVGSRPADELLAVVPAFTCPPGSAPDRPGPAGQTRPPSFGYAAFDREFGKIVLVASGRLGFDTWTFDVCSNTWLAMHPESEPDSPYGGTGMAVYDAAARRTIVVSPNPGGVWAYDLAANTWTRLADAPLASEMRVAYDSVAERVVALRVGLPSLVWSFDSTRGAWQPLDLNGDPDPWHVSDDHILLAYDASVDRLVGYEQGEVRLFDRRAGTWSPPRTWSPSFGYGGYYSLGGEIAYDDVAHRTVLFSDGHVIAYDAAADRWETLYGIDFSFPNDCGVHPECRSQPFMVYDPTNARIVVYGGNVRTGPGYGPSDDVLAFDTRTREWLQLLAPSSPLVPDLSPGASASAGP